MTHHDLAGRTRARLTPLAIGLALALSANLAQAEQHHPRATPRHLVDHQHHPLTRVTSLKERLRANPVTAEKLAQKRTKALAGRIKHQAHVLARVSPPNRPAATLPVTNCLDDGSPGTLRSVVNGAASGDVVDLSGLVCSSITLTSGAIITPQTDLTLRGPASGALTICAGNTSRVIENYVGGGGAVDTNLTIENLTIANGLYDGYSLGAYFSSGGCIITTGNVTLTNSTVTGCEAYGKYAAGGAVYANNITITGSTVSNSTAHASFKYYSGYYYLTPALGGGTYSIADSQITNSTVTANTAEAYVPGYSYGQGGGVYGRGRVSITSSEISSNTADVGGAALSALSAGGGAGNRPAGNASAVTLLNSTVSGNTALLGGGGIVAFNLPAQVISSTVTANNGGALGGGGFIDLHDATSYGSSELNGSIIALNGAAGSRYDADVGVYYDGTAFVGANNLVIAAATGGNGATPVLPAGTLNANPLLGALANNGGRSRTHALQPGSPAIDTGNNVAGQATDQRGTGFARSSGAAPDIGAFEVQAAAPLVIREVPTLSQWAMAALAGLLTWVGWRSQRRQGAMRRR